MFDFNLITFVIYLCRKYKSKFLTHVLFLVIIQRLLKIYLYRTVSFR